MFFLSLISSFFNAINALYAKKITGEIKDNNSFIVASFLYVAIFLGLSMPWFYSFQVTPVSLALVVLVILLDTLANVLFFLSMERIEVSRLAVYSALTPLFTFVPNTFLHGFNAHVLISVLVIVLGVYMLNMKNGNPIMPLLELKKPGNLLGLATAFVYGISMVPTQQILVHQWANAPTLYFFRACGIALLIYICYRPRVWFPKANTHLCLRGLTVIIQWLCLFTALHYADGTLVVSLAYTSPLFAVFLARIYFKERITFGKLAACCITIVGILWTIY
jgi:drug/metabolite transporter (DMT)-like permease